MTKNWVKVFSVFVIPAKARIHYFFYVVFIGFFTVLPFVHALDNPNDWSRHQSVRVAKAGLVRWTVPFDTIGQGRPDRGDFRLLDPQGREVPYGLYEPRPLEEAKIFPVWLVFRAPTAGDYRFLVGNSKTSAPSYDLAVLKDSLAQGPFEHATAGPLELNPSYQKPEVLPALAETGAVLDVSDWTHRVSVSLDGSGFHFIELPLSALLHATPFGQDFRLIRDGRQIPWLADRTTRTKSVTPRVTVLGEEKGKSRWEMVFPLEGIPLTHVECRASNPLFQRNLIIYEDVTDDRGEPTRRILGQFSWARTSLAGPDFRVFPLTHPPTTDRLVVEVDNGDNAPLSLDGFKAYYQTWRLVFKASPGHPLFLYYGRPQVGWPRYDLTLVATEALSADQREAHLGHEEEIHPSSSWGRVGLVGPWKIVFWVVLGAVVVILLSVLKKLLPKVNE